MGQTIWTAGENDSLTINVRTDQLDHEPASIHFQSKGSNQTINLPAEVTGEMELVQTGSYDSGSWTYYTAELVSSDGLTLVAFTQTSSIDFTLDDITINRDVTYAVTA